MLVFPLSRHVLSDAGSIEQRESLLPCRHHSILSTVAVYFLVADVRKYRAWTEVAEIYYLKSM